MKTTETNKHLFSWAITANPHNAPANKGHVRTPPRRSVNLQQRNEARLKRQNNRKPSYSPAANR